MTQGVGLSVGATSFATVVPGCAAVTRRPVLTLYRHRPPEVGVPAENPRLDERGLIVTDFVDRAADPVGIMAVDGTFHRGEALIASALRAVTYAATGGRTPVAAPGVTHPAHWRPGAVAALRRELARLPEWSAGSVPLISDVTAALTALQADPGLPTRGVIALCDFGGTGTSITLADAADGYRQIGATVRHPDLSGELIDRALLTHVLADLSIGGTADVTGTAAFGALHRLRSECRRAKERLSRGAATTLDVDVPGYRGEVRLTRAELDDEIRQPLASFVDVLQEHLARNRIHLSDLAAVASVGGGANIPAVTTALSDQLRVPVITTPRPELIAATGAALHAVRRPNDDSTTEVAAPVQSTKMRPIAWSEVDDVPEIALLADDSEALPGTSAARPVIDFVPEEEDGVRRPTARYRSILVTVGVFAAMVLLGSGAVLAIRNDVSAMPDTTPPTKTVIQPAPAAPAAAAAPPASEAPSAPSYIQAAPAPTRVVVSTPPPVILRAPAPAPAPAAPPPIADAPPPPPAAPPASEPPAEPPPQDQPPEDPPPQDPPPQDPPSSEPSEPEPPAPDEPPADGAEQQP